MQRVLLLALALRMGIAARGELSHSLVPSSSSAAIFGGGFPSLGTTGMCGTAMERESAQRTHGANLAGTEAPVM